MAELFQCDRCHSVFLQEKSEVTIRRILRLSNGASKDWDLCKSCFFAFQRFMGDKCGRYHGPPCNVSDEPVDTRDALDGEKTKVVALPSGDRFPSFLPPVDPEPER